MVALVVSIIAAVVMTIGILWYARRRPKGTPDTWGEAMLGSAYVFFLAFLAYGIIPHQWLTLAENELSWRADRLVVSPADGPLIPFDITYRTLSDSIAGVFYVIFLGGQIWLWLVWQNRDKQKDKSTEVVKSSYGRPLVKQG